MCQKHFKHLDLGHSFIFDKCTVRADIGRVTEIKAHFENRDASESSKSLDM